jgi:hypothetical protein
MLRELHGDQPGHFAGILLWIPNPFFTYSLEPGKMVLIVAGGILRHRLGPTRWLEQKSYLPLEGYSLPLL